MPTRKDAPQRCKSGLALFRAAIVCTRYARAYSAFGQFALHSFWHESFCAQLALSHSLPSPWAQHAVPSFAAACPPSTVASTVVVSVLVVLLLLAFPPHAIKAIAEATIMAEIMTFFIVLRFCCFFLLLTTQGTIALHQILMRLFFLLFLCEPTPLHPTAGGRYPSFRH